MSVPYLANVATAMLPERFDWDELRGRLAGGHFDLPFEGRVEASRQH
jgi:hypothetical protein